MNAMHAIICCVIAMLLFDVVVAINVYVVSKATPAISAKNRDNDLNRVKMATRRRLRGQILATQKETLQDEERFDLDIKSGEDPGASFPFSRP
ncbi:RxLR-like protein [Plasmopara halstedii]|uniref:RxLR-like protein n=1 Tax=Plasmopara halstedii TaxID=4781 RepID=A0A0P1AYD0_PLAHL|nr:RxLR-like protein [Plasmopara halstedii]CEG46133.1 RxLR-like protein [Plasmopara halstedii]|eukprot:XP_024582502.1 RxLR-like protein [Plasmopara halstedii]